jgi:uncharacterized protein (TIGR02996 family)
MVTLLVLPLLCTLEQMNEHALLADPQDWLAWLAYADALEERGKKLFSSLAREVGQKQGRAISRSAFHFYLAPERWRCTTTSPISFRALPSLCLVDADDPEWEPADWEVICPIIRALPPWRTRTRLWVAWPFMSRDQLDIRNVVFHSTFGGVLHGLAPIMARMTGDVLSREVSVRPGKLYLDDQGKVVGFILGVVEREGPCRADHALEFGRRTRRTVLVGRRGRPAKATP